MEKTIEKTNDFEEFKQFFKRMGIPIKIMQRHEFHCDGPINESWEHPWMDVKVTFFPNGNNGYSDLYLFDFDNKFLGIQPESKDSFIPRMSNSVKFIKEEE